MSKPRVSVIVPAYNEGDSILRLFDDICDSVKMSFEVLVVYDTSDDTTAPYANDYAKSDSRIKPTLNTYGRGPANAIRFGIDHAKAPVVVVTMADGADDPQQVEPLARLVERGVVVAAASRYMRSGQQVGGPFLKRTLSRLAGLSLFHLGRVGVHDATNSFKAYSRGFVEQVGIESRSGFEIGIELVAKAKRARQPVAELPTIWLDRTTGASNFKIARWLPKYLKWYLFAFGPRIDFDPKMEGSRPRLATTVKPRSA